MKPCTKCKRVCRKCGERKPLADFREFMAQGKYHYRRSACRACEKIAWTLNNRSRHERHPLDPDGVHCLICGAGPFIAVGNHTNRIHGVSRRDYLKRFPGAKMTPEHLREAWDLELKDRRPKSKRRRHCPRGHPLRGKNVYTFPSGRRCCRTCKRASSLAYMWRRYGEGACIDCGARCFGRAARCKPCHVRYMGLGNRKVGSRGKV